MLSFWIRNRNEIRGELEGLFGINVVVDIDK